jgi:hypothetical protein
MIKDIVGQRFNRLIVISFLSTDNKKKVAMWNCLCDCGNTHIASGVNLRSGAVRSCGCLQKEVCSDREPPNFKDLSGKKFGKLTVVKKQGRQGSFALWECLCDCGETSFVITTNLTRGKQVSCGCYNKKLQTELHTTHDLYNHPLYSVWSSIKTRCYNSKCKHYNRYGGRGIKVCEQWLDFINFYNDMLIGYEKGLTIDRIDNNGNYEPSNCRWATTKEQQNNKRSSVFMEYNNEVKTLKQWADYYSIDYHSLWSRHKKGYTPHQVIFGKIKNKRNGL